MKRIVSLAAALLLFLGCARAEGIAIREIAKYGNLVLEISGTELLAQGYDYGDIITVNMADNSFEMPIGSNYSDVDNGCMVCRVYINGETGVIEIGGLVGQHGGVNSYEGEGRGCVVDCDIVYDWGNHKWYGLVIGWNYSASAVVVMGTPEEPIKILGGSMSCDGGKTVIPITAENYETYAKGAGSEPHTVHVKFGN